MTCSLSPLDAETSSLCLLSVAKINVVCPHDWEKWRHQVQSWWNLALTVLMCACQDPESITTWGTPLPGPRAHDHLRASSGPLHPVSNPSQARRFYQALHRVQYLTLISFLKHLQLFSVWYKRGSFRLYLRWAQTTYPAQWQMSWDWMATGLGGNTCFPQARAHSHKYFVSSPQPQKPESYSYEKLTFFCQVSPSKSCSLHRAPIAAPNTLKKSTLFYPKTVGTWWFGSAGAAKQVSAVHTTPAFISLLWFCAGGYKEVVPPQCCELQLLAGDGGLNLYRHLGRQGDEAELNLLQKQSIRK